MSMIVEVTTEQADLFLRDTLAAGGRVPNEPVAHPSYFRWKGVLDRIAAALLLIPAVPLIGGLIILIRITSPGPAIYRQIRVGRSGRAFTMYKLRSMRCDAEAHTGPVWTCGKQDPRITRVGRLLRNLHLDELPQLFNVLRGEMSLVGPRPERPEFVAVLADRIPGYVQRLQVLPGVTGLAQINLPPDTDLASVRRKQTLDLEYVRTASLGLDVRMLLCTLLRLIGCSGERAMKLMRLRRHVKLDVVPEPHATADAQDHHRLSPEEILQQKLRAGGTRQVKVIHIEAPDPDEQEEVASEAHSNSRAANGPLQRPASKPR